MTEEITYADLEFNKSNALENNPKTEEKGLRTSFPWRLAALTILTLCLALLVGLLALGVMWINCTLCPTNWQRMGRDTCYFISTERKTWEQSRNFCSSQNSTLLLIKDKEKLQYTGQYFIKERHWIGLSYNTQRAAWFWEDNTAFSPSEKSIYIYYTSNPCAYLLDKYIYANQHCNENNFWL